MPARAPSKARRSAPYPTVAAVVSSGERSSLDAASLGCFSVLHRSSVPEIVRVVRERPVDAVLLSVHQCHDERTDQVDELVRNFPALPTVALISRHDVRVSEALLRLGANGIRQVVDVSAPAGWRRLRQLVTEPASRAAARILGPVMAALPDLSADGRLFLEILVRMAPDISAVLPIARRLNQCPSTLTSRFQRAGLPSPKTYLNAVRLLYAAHYFEGGARSIADVSYQLDCSSPQSFGRTVRVMLGITPSEFRRRYPFLIALDRFIDQLVVPYRDAWSRLRPLRGCNRKGLEALESQISSSSKRN